MKKEKKRLTKEYEDIYSYYINLKNEHHTLTQSLELALAEYKLKYKKKEDDEVMLKQEMKARLLKSQLDSLTIKLSNAEYILDGAKKTMDDHNMKISSFVQSRNEKKENLCLSTLRSIIFTFANNISHIEKLFVTIFQTQINPQSEEGTISGAGSSPSSKGGNEHPSDKINNNPVNLQVERKSSAGTPPNSQNKIKPCISSFKCSEENKLGQMVEDFKIIIEDLSFAYHEALFIYNKEMKKSKDIVSMLRHLVEYEEVYIKEREKLLSLNLTNLKPEVLLTQWKMIQSNLYLANRLKTYLREVHFFSGCIINIIENRKP